MARPVRFGSEDALAIVEYNRALYERFARQVRRLPGSRAFQKRGIGHESLFDTLVHIVNVQEVWLLYINRGRNSDPELGALFENPARHPKDWKALDGYAARVWDEVEEVTERLSAKQLGAPVSVFWMKGRYTVRDGYLQATLEEAMHVGEIIGALWQKNVATSKMTWIDVRREVSSRARRRR
jgi:uncharacterized damage-inducible protein DinB